MHGDRYELKNERYSTTDWLNGAPVPMQLGEAWYLNLNLRHRVENVGSAARIHLVVDCVVNDLPVSAYLVLSSYKDDEIVAEIATMLDERLSERGRQ